MGDLFRDTLHRVHSKSIGLRSRLSEAWGYLRGPGGTSISKQEEAYDFAAEKSLMKKPLLTFMDEEQWEQPGREVPVLTSREDGVDWGDATTRAIDTVYKRYQSLSVE